LDLPGIIEGAAEGKGRGRQVISAAKTSDLILMILDATKKAEQRALLEAELEAVGIRLNCEPPYVFFLTPQAQLLTSQEHIFEAKDCWRYENHISEPAKEPRPKDGVQHSP